MSSYEYVRGRLRIVVDTGNKEIKLVGVVGDNEECGFNMDPGATYGLVEALIYVLDKYFSNKPIGYSKPKHDFIEIRVVNS